MGRCESENLMSAVDVFLSLATILFWFFSLQTFIRKAFSVHHNIEGGYHFAGGETRDCYSGFPSMKSAKPSNKKAMGQNSGKYSFYNTLEEFGYQFNDEGQLRHTTTNEPFNFEVKPGDRAYNQKHYEALGEVITEHVYELLETKGNLRRFFLPVDAKEEPLNFIFHSENAWECDKLMILIHGSGVVRAGQWTRKLIINDCLDSGTMLPYIRKAAEEGYGILVTNGNNNFVTEKKKRKHIRGSNNPEEHFVYVWDHVISKAKASTINIVAHSYGGVVTVHMSKTRKDEFLKRVKTVAFTDSVHSLAYQVVDKEIEHFFQKNARNWVSCDKPLDTPVPAMFKIADCERVSAGTIRHEETSWAAFESVFRYFAEKEKDCNSSSSVDTGHPVTSGGEQQSTQPQQENMAGQPESIDQEMDQKEDTTKATGHLGTTDQVMGQKEGATEETGQPKTNEEGMEQKEDITEDIGHTGNTDKGMEQREDITQETGHPGTTDRGIEQRKDITQETGHMATTDQGIEQGKDITQETGHMGTTDQGMEQREDITQETCHLGTTDQGMEQRKDITQETGHPGTTDQGMEQKKDINQETGHPEITDQGMEQRKDITQEAGHPGTTDQGMEQKKDINQETGHPEITDQGMEQRKDIAEQTQHLGTTEVEKFNQAHDTSRREDKIKEDKPRKSEL